MPEPTIRDRIEQQVGKALLKNAFFNLPSALMIGATILATAIMPDLVPVIPWFAWPIFGFAGEAAIVVASLTDKAGQEKLIESLFREKYSLEGIRDRKLREKLKEADEYRQRIQSVVERQRSGVLRDRLKVTTGQVYDWIANMVALARRIDEYRSDQIIRRDLRDVPRGIEQLKQRLALETDPRVRQQMTTTLASNQQQLAALRELSGRMERADLQLDHSLAALGTVYSQMLLIGSKDVDSDRAERLGDDIRGEVMALQDLVDSLNEIYDGGLPSFEAARPAAAAGDAATDEAQRARRAQSARR
ncbi:MAG: hypothetical protein BWY52_02635 [Chloroflexi bacterium ADurb.Bin325]|nr:MAG: hypothetical protein BWY52_02635 [Chloroflexi bacterium ADurb.Bin325]